MESNQAYKALDKIGWGSYNLRVFLQCSLSLVVYEGMFVGIAYFLQGAFEEWKTPPLVLGVIASLYHVGMLFGNLTWGFLSDKKGRKLPYRVVSLVGLLSGSLIFLSINQFMMAGGIFLLGFSMSGELSLSPTVFCEFCPPNRRNLLTLLYLSLSIGAIVVSLVALVVVYLNSSSFYDWRIISGSMLVVIIFNTISKFFVQETPAFLYRNKEIRESEELLNEISQKNKKKSFSFEEISSILNENESFSGKDQSLLTEIQEDPPISVLVKRLFSKRLILVTIRLSLVRKKQAMCLCLFSFAGFVNFMPELLGFLSTSDAYLVIMIQQAAGVPGSLLGTYLVKTRLGRKWTTFLSLFISGVFNVLFPLAVATTSVIFLFTYMGYSALSTLAAESLPTQVRSTGMSFFSIFARIAGISAPIISGVLLQENQEFLLMCLFAAANIACAVLVTTLKETRKIEGLNKVEPN